MGEEHEGTDNQNDSQLESLPESEIGEYSGDASSSDSVLSRVRSEGFSCSVSEATCSCVSVLLTIWIMVSLTLMLGLYGSTHVRLGPNCSYLVRANPIFVDYVKVKQLYDTEHGATLYGFYEDPPLDVFVDSSTSHSVTLPARSQKDWIYFLNKGSQMNISITFKSSSSPSLVLVIAEGMESHTHWLDDPIYPSTMLSRNIIRGNATLQDSFTKSSNYFVSVVNLNSDILEELDERGNAVRIYDPDLQILQSKSVIKSRDFSKKMLRNVEGETSMESHLNPLQLLINLLKQITTQLNFNVRALVYNTSEAHYMCSLVHGECSFNTLFPYGNSAVLTTPDSKQDMSYDDWYIKVSYGPRWITYSVGLGGIAVLIFLASRLMNCHCIGNVAQYREIGSERAHLLSNKDDDMSSLGSSYDSASQDDEEVYNEQLKDGTIDNKIHRLCAICFEARRDSFFLPCGHCVACFTCGTRIMEISMTCPICRRNAKKVKKIIVV